MSDLLSVSSDGLIVWCPACDMAHRISLGPGGWTWDRNLDRPTISPSIRVDGIQWAEGKHFHKPRHHVEAGQPTVCHSFIRAGRWQYLGDCTHDLAGQTVDMVPLPA